MHLVANRHLTRQKIFLVLWLTTIVVAFSVFQTAFAKSDIRVLVDVSGSMKENDPKNLRAPALRMLTSLIPPGSQAGVWSFGEYVNLLVAPRKVDADWKERAIQATRDIHSRSVFTNMGDGLQRSIAGIKTFKEDELRNVILLTDGMIDISKDKEINEKERNKVLNQMIPRLQHLGITVHTVALSNNADMSLLKTLSGKTDGWFLKVTDASQLEKAFLKLFEQSTRGDSLPLTNNRFKVDRNVDEFTLLVFRQPNSPGTELITPTGNNLRFDSRLPPNMTWYHEATYDLITVKEPDIGEWIAEADFDPDNRVMVVTDLNLRINKLPNNAFVGETILAQLNLENSGVVITNESFLSNVRMSLTKSLGDEAKLRSLALDEGEEGDQSAGDGVFSSLIGPFHQVGEWKISAEAKSPTFERHVKTAIQVHASPIDVRLIPPTVDLQYRVLRLIPYTDLIEKDSLFVTADILYPDGEKVRATANQGENYNEIVLKLLPNGGAMKVMLYVRGRTQGERQFKVDIGPMTIELPELDYALLKRQREEAEAKAAALKAEQEAAALAEKAKKAENIGEDMMEYEGQEDKEEVKSEDKIKEEGDEKEAEKDSEEAADDEQESMPGESETDASEETEGDKEAEETEDDMPLAIWLALGLGVNLLLGGIGFGVYALMKKRQAMKALNDEDDKQVPEIDVGDESDEEDIDLGDELEDEDSV